MTGINYMGEATVVSVVFVVLAVGLSTLYVMRASYMPLVLRSNSLALLSVLLLVIPPAIEIFALEAGAVNHGATCMAIRIAAVASLGAFATAIFLRTMRLAGMHAVQIAVKELKYELRADFGSQGRSGSGSRSSNAQVAAAVVADGVMGGDSSTFMAAGRRPPIARLAAVALGTGNPAGVDQTLLAGALNLFKSTSSEGSCGPEPARAPGQGRFLPAPRRVIPASESFSSSNSASARRNAHKQRLLSRVRRLRRWMGPRVQAAVAAGGVVLWAAIPLAIDLAMASPAGDDPASCAVLPLQVWASMWPSLAITLGGTALVLLSLRAINESVSLRLELTMASAACLASAAIHTAHVLVPSSLTLETASAASLGLGIASTLAWPLYLSFSRRFSTVNSVIDAEKIARLVTFTASPAGARRPNGDLAELETEPLPTDIELPRLPDLLAELDMTACIAHPDAYEQFQQFSESEMASENIFFLESVFLFKLGVITSMVRAGVTYDATSATLRRLRSWDRAKLQRDIRSLINHRVFVHGANGTLAWLVHLVESDDAWESLVRLPTQAGDDVSAKQTVSAFVVGAAARPSTDATPGDVPHIATAPHSGTPAALQGDAKIAGSCALCTASASAAADTAAGLDFAMSDDPQPCSARCTCRRSVSESSLGSGNHRHADVSIEEVEALIRDGVADISEQFILPDAAMEINISSRTRTACLTTIDSSPLATGPYTFDNPARTVRSTLRRDTFPRFQRSPVVLAWFAKRPWSLAPPSVGDAQ